MTNHQLIHGSNLEVLPTLPDNYADAIVTDPPYELGFMGKAWDSTGIAYSVKLWSECLRVLKPGGHLLAFGGSRTYHRMTCAIEDAGFEIRDQIMWVYGSGFPKSHNVRKALERDEASADLAEQWEGWGTALKPAHEPICLARKPPESTIASNVTKWGVGGINIDVCRVKHTETFGELPNRGGRRVFNTEGKTFAEAGFDYKEGNLNREAVEKLKTLGRFPANLMHDGSQQVLDLFPSNAGSAARFFYCPKASKSDRDALNNHPTVKPTELMRYLCRLITPPKGLILDPFNGSGSTGKAALLEGFSYLGIELNLDYIKISEARLNDLNT
jgi:DNA modification methylase